METNGTLAFSFESQAEDFYAAACAVDRKNKLDRRRMLQGSALVIVAFMFIPPQNFLHWGMLALCVAMGLMIWKYPDLMNRRFAQRRAAASPRFEMTATQEGLEAFDGSSREHIRFDEGCAVYRYHDILAVNWSGNRVLAIPVSRLNSETAERLEALLRTGLGDRFEELAEGKNNAKGPFSRRENG